jgi:hypothetical protein
MGIRQEKLMAGAEAPAAWRRGDHNSVLKYVSGDVQMTTELITRLERDGELRWVTQRGTLAVEPMQPLLTVDEAQQLPQPDQSWMEAPIDIPAMLAWRDQSLLAPTIRSAMQPGRALPSLDPLPRDGALASGQESAALTPAGMQDSERPSMMVVDFELDSKPSAHDELGRWWGTPRPATSRALLQLNLDSDRRNSWRATDRSGRTLIGISAALAGQGRLAEARDALREAEGLRQGGDYRSYRRFRWDLAEAYLDLGLPLDACRVHDGIRVKAALAEPVPRSRDLLDGLEDPWNRASGYIGLARKQLGGKDQLRGLSEASARLIEVTLDGPPCAIDCNDSAESTANPQGSDREDVWAGESIGGHDSEDAFYCPSNPEPCEYCEAGARGCNSCRTLEETAFNLRYGWEELIGLAAQAGPLGVLIVTEGIHRSLLDPGYGRPRLIAWRKSLRSLYQPLDAQRTSNLSAVLHPREIDLWRPRSSDLGPPARPDEVAEMASIARSLAWTRSLPLAGPYLMTAWSELRGISDPYPLARIASGLLLCGDETNGTRALDLARRACSDQDTRYRRSICMADLALQLAPGNPDLAEQVASEAELYEEDGSASDWQEWRKVANAI